MSIKRPQDLRVRWLGGEVGWVVDTLVALTDVQLKRVAVWIVRQQKDRWLGLPPGERKEECLKTIEAALEGRVRCRIVEERVGAGTVAFASTERTRPDRTFFVEGVDS